MVTAPGSRRRHRETRRGGSPRGGSSQPAPTKPAAMGSPQRPPLAHVFKGTFVHSSASAPMDILRGHLLGVDDNGTVSGARAGGGGDARPSVRVRSGDGGPAAPLRRRQGPAASASWADQGRDGSVRRKRRIFALSLSGQAPRRRDLALEGAGGNRGRASPRHESAVGVNLLLILSVPRAAACLHLAFFQILCCLSVSQAFFFILRLSKQ